MKFYRNLTMLSLGGVLMLSFAMLAQAPSDKANAAAPALRCNVAIVLDISHSVTEESMGIFKTQIMKLFDKNGSTSLNTDRWGPYLKLAFWTFSADNLMNGPNFNYNSYYSDYVNINSASGSIAFESKLNTLPKEGKNGTSYEQAMTVKNGVPNSRLTELVRNTDIVVVLSDGGPNIPSGYDPGWSTKTSSEENNGAALREANKAARMFLDSQPRGYQRAILGGAVRNKYTNRVAETKLGLAKMIDGKAATANSSPRVFNIENEDAISREVSKIVLSDSEGCGSLAPNKKSYTITPEVKDSPSRSVAPGGSVSINYGASVNVNGDLTVPAKDWGITRVVLNSGKSSDYITSQELEGDLAKCDSIRSKLGGQAAVISCDEKVAEGTQEFPSKTAGYKPFTSSPSSVPVGENLPFGAKVCFMLVVMQPKQDSAPTSRVASKAVCIDVGKRPYVQVWGGDVRAGGIFYTDTRDGTTDGGDTNSTELGVYGSSYTDADAGKTYGSWVEYGIISSGPVKGVASMSAWSGTPIDRGGNSTADPNRLTFANADSSNLGYFTDKKGVIGNIPDSIKGILASHKVVRGDAIAGDVVKGEVKSIKFAENGDVHVNNQLVTSGNTNGIYSNRSSSSSVSIGASKLGGGKSVVVYAPNTRVVIMGNIEYDEGPYYDIKDIPQLVIIADEIVVFPDVDRIDAWLIANGEKGTINTCHHIPWWILTTKTCDTQLRINGPVMARNLMLMRTYGADKARGGLDDPAEIINLSGSSFLWSQSAGKSDVRIQTTHTTELPPYF